MTAQNRFLTVRNAAASVVALPLLLAGQAHAALPEGVSTALDSAKGDAAMVGGLVLVIIIGIAAFKFIRRAI
ncbi:MAG: major capsid protein [Burkholderiaceae bacterium]|nr:major capsid protein [Burkholderiaceae bacterium]